MNFSENLIQVLAGKHLLKHPFYEAWNKGELSKETLKLYARQYYHHVAAFPRYISQTHAQSENIKFRQVLLENLVDEERGENNHPELWMRFAEGLGETRENIKNETLLPQTQNLISNFVEKSKSSFAEGLGALFAYEHQVPEVAASKIDGLQKHYAVSEERALEFFNVHLKADVYHTQALCEILNSLSPDDQVRAREAARASSEALWGFLDGVQGDSPVACNM